jgi:hypothetical protein
MRLCSVRALVLVPLLTLPGVFYSAGAQQPERAPAVPLVVHNPYFSIWSMNDNLTDGPTRHWTGTPQALTGLARIDGHPFRYMGNVPRDVPAMKQVALTIAPTHTTYVFEEAGVRLTVAFFTPAFPRDMDLLSRPVSYLTWTAASADGQAHQVEVLLDVDPLVAVNTDDQEVTWGRSQVTGLSVMNVGSRTQQVLNRSGDNLRIDWGYFHLALPTAAGTQEDGAVTALSPSAITDFAQNGKLAPSDDMDMPRTPHDGAAHLAVALRLDCDRARSGTQHVLLAYTQGYAIEYLERKLRPYWQRDGETVAAMLGDAEAQYSALEARGKQYDDELTADLIRAGGTGYAELAVLAYRQTLGAHMLVADDAGRPMLFAKENFSNGDIGTVDVLYPSSPFFCCSIRPCSRRRCGPF